MKVLRTPNHLNSSLTKRIVYGPVGKTITVALAASISSCGTAAEQAAQQRELEREWHKITGEKDSSPSATSPASPKASCTESAAHKQFLINFNAHMEQEGKVKSDMDDLTNKNNGLFKASQELGEKVKSTNDVAQLKSLQTQGEEIVKSMEANNSAYKTLQTELTRLQGSRPKPVCSSTSLNPNRHLAAFKAANPQHFRLKA